MDNMEAGQMWNDNADVWTELSRAGYDVCRDLFNTPTFLEMLPNVNNLQGLDIGCGEGHNTRLLARRGARMTGIDVSERFIEHARTEEEPMRKDNITRLVAIQAFSVQRIEFGREAILVETRGV